MNQNNLTTSYQDTLIANRLKRIEAWKKGPMIPAPLRLNNTAYTIGTGEIPANVVRFADGTHWILATAGTTDAAEPVATPMGRPLTDGSCVWYQDQWRTDKLAEGAPTVKPVTAAQLAGEGLIFTRFAVTSGLPFVVDSEDVIVGSFSTNYLSSYNQVVNFSGGGNSTGDVVGTNAAGFKGGVACTRSFAYDKAAHSELTFDVTDHKFSLGFHNFGAQAMVTIDGRLVQGEPSRFTVGGDAGLIYDFNGEFKRRTITVPAAAQFRGVGLTAKGFVSATPKGNDTMLLLADSYGSTSNPSLFLMGVMGYHLKKELGLSGMINCTSGGTGYFNKVTAQQLNMLERLNNVDNIAAWTYLNPSHILFAMGNNDVNQNESNARYYMRASWEKARGLFPNAKISVWTCHGGSTGPSAGTFAMGAAIRAEFRAWNDPNSRLIDILGTSAAQSIVSGTSRIDLAINAAENVSFVGGFNDNAHPSPFGARYLAQRLAQYINAAWNGEY